MVVQVGVMELPVTEDPDDIQTYMNGEHTSGGLWTALTRSSNHDHSGGLNGVQLGATSIPDGSITTAKLDPSVLLPYSLVDGSKPFTGQVTMEADAIVRDAVYFGQQGSASPADATLSRTGPGALRLSGAANSGLEVRATGALAGAHVGQVVPGPRLDATANLAFDGDELEPGGHRLRGRPPGAGGGHPAPDPYRRGGANPATPRLTNRLHLAPTGTLTLTPDTGVDGLTVNVGGSGPFTVSRTGTDPLVYTGTAWLKHQGGGVAPSGDNAMYHGFSSNRWIAVYAVNGTIQTSSREYKEGITPLDPAACYQAAKDVRWYEFAYLPPVYQEPEPPPDIVYDEHDSNETKAEKRAAREEAEAGAREAYARMLVETAPARHQRGFVFPDGAEEKDELGGALPPVPDLFGLSDRQSTTPQADLATLGCALQEVMRRLEALEGAPAR